MSVTCRWLCCLLLFMAGCHGELLQSSVLSEQMQQDHHAGPSLAQQQQHKQQQKLHDVQHSIGSIREHHSALHHSTSAAPPVHPHLTSSISISIRSSAGLVRPALKRSLLEYRPSQAEKESAAKHAGKMSAGHAAGVTLLCVLAMAVLGFIGYKALQWYERTRRPGYVELQALDTAYHGPTFTL